MIYVEGVSLFKINPLNKLTMRKILPVAIVVALLASCDMFESSGNDDENDNPCQIVSEEVVPKIVKDSLSMRYPGIIPIAWLNKDSTGYCVNFKDGSGKVIMVLFSNTGKFVAEEENINVEQTGQHDDKQPDDSGCSCEMKSNVGT